MGMRGAVRRAAASLGIALLALGKSALDTETLDSTKGALLKTTADFDILRGQLNTLIPPLDAA